MADFEIRQCPEKSCGIRMPIDRELYQGTYCPVCGALMDCAVPAFQNQPCLSGSQPPRRISVLLDNIRSAHNVGAIFRTADGVGVDHVYLCGITPVPDENVAIQKTSLGAEQSVSWSYHRNALRLVEDLSQRGYCILVLECTPEAIPVFEYRLKNETTPLVLVVGNEQSGVDPGLIACCDQVLGLTMSGKKSSLNVSVAFGVAAYWLSSV